MLRTYRLKPDSKLNASLSMLPLFRSLQADQIARIASGTTEIDARRGTTIFTRGDACEGLHIVVFGMVKLSIATEQGDERVLELVGPGGSLSPGPLFHDRGRRLNAQALHDTKLIHVAKSTLLAEFEQSTVLARRMMSDLTQRVEQLVNNMEICTLRPGKQRIVWLLLSLLDESQGRASGSITLPARKGVLASRLNLTHEHFSRMLSELARTGAIALNGRQVEIPDVALLKMLGGKFETPGTARSADRKALYA